MSDTLLLARIYDFAARMHAGQTRKGAAAEPYINHPCEVASLLADASGGTDPLLVAGGVLHDTVEDTPATEAQLLDMFGRDIARLVMEVTDDKSLPKAERKRLQIEHAAAASPRAKMLKIADKTSNLRSLATSPPHDWPQDRLEAYVSWSRSVVDNWRGHNAWLESRFDDAVALALACLGRQARP